MFHNGTLGVAAEVSSSADFIAGLSWRKTSYRTKNQSHGTAAS